MRNDNGGRDPAAVMARDEATLREMRAAANATPDGDPKARRRFEEGAEAVETGRSIAGCIWLDAGRAYRRKLVRRRNRAAFEAMSWYGPAAGLLPHQRLGAELPLVNPASAAALTEWPG